MILDCFSSFVLLFPLFPSPPPDFPNFQQGLNAPRFHAVYLYFQNGDVKAHTLLLYVARQAVAGPGIGEM